MRCGLDVSSNFFGCFGFGRIMPTCLIGFGANLNDRRQTLEAAASRLAQGAAVRVTGRSRWCATAPIGGPSGQGEYLNGVIRAETALEPEALLLLLQRIEDEAGRRRERRWDARTLDLDLLLYDQLEIVTPRLIVPHPRMEFRRFVLEPASEVAAEMVHPTTGWTIQRLFDHLQTAPCYVAVTGAPAAGKTALARRLAESVPARLIVDATDGPRVEPVSNEPPGQLSPLAVELQRLERRTHMLAAAARPKSGETLISDFWLEQSAAYAAKRLANDDLAALEAAVQRAQSRVLSPKLLIVLIAGASERQREVHQILARRARAAERCPRLLVRSDSPPAAYEEAFAAIDAMR